MSNDKKFQEQQEVLQNQKKNLLVSASAGSGKTHVMIEYVCNLICEKKVPLSQILILTFTKAAAAQMKDKLLEELKRKGDDPFIVDQMDSLPTANISTIHAFCEKCIKKHANLLGINANFHVLDEYVARQICQQAFFKAYEAFEKEDFDNFLLLASSFKNDERKIAKVVFEIENLAGAVADRDEFLKRNMSDAEGYFQKAVQFLFENSKLEICEQLARIEKLHVGDFEFDLRRSLDGFLKSCDIFDMSNQVVVFPRMRNKKELGQEVADQLDEAVQQIKKVVKEIQALNLTDEENVMFQKSGRLEKAFIKFFQRYEREAQKIKQAQNGMDFYDLEKWMKKLSENENLFSTLKYVFVDEYQDTNKIQERILKNVAKNCNFVAVGDVKQGIYGFRLASAEIFLKDIQDFDGSDDGDVKFLKFNFRSRQQVLDFVNRIFCVCMTEQLTGVDYRSTSMLKSADLVDFVDEGEKPVNIDVVTMPAQEQESIPKIYSVKEAKLSVDNQNETMLLDIKRRILQVMKSKISDNGVLRPVKFGDIAILARKRDNLFLQLEKFLQENDIPVVANSRHILMESPYMQMLLNFLKIALCLDDDIACCSVLLGIFHFRLEDLMGDSSICEMVKQDESGKFAFFNKCLKDFRFNSVVYGIRKALVDLFDKTDFRAFINLNHRELSAHVDKFLEEVEKFDFDLPALIEYFETVDIVVTNDASLEEDCVELSTIHNSKGLEFPIVFLIGCDQDLFKKREEVEINEEFGLALKVFDQENNSEMTTARMQAVQKSRQKKNFMEELMIFYVALTRAKNRLYLFGLKKDNAFKKTSLNACRSYFDFMFHALSKEKEAFLKEGKFEDETLAINLIEKVEEVQFGQEQTMQEFEPEVVQKIKDYLAFTYKLGNEQNFKLKESVTGLTSKNQESEIEKYSNENFNFGGKNLEIGNAYHLALKVLDFDNVVDMNSLKNEILRTNVDIHLIDLELLLRNILLLKEVTGSGQVFKEKQFILKGRVCDLVDTDVTEEILVQGVVDLFVKNKNTVTLVDYKYSNRNNLDLMRKYEGQLRLYKRAIEQAFNVKVDKMFLLSLKKAQMIELK